MKHFTHITRLVFGLLASSTFVGVTQAQQTAVEWRVQDGGNGHWYAAHSVGNAGIDWNEANAVALGQSAHLATLTTAEEGEFVWIHLASDPDCWRTALNQAGPRLGGFYSKNGWQWVTGEPWNYSNGGSCFGPVHYENTLHFGCDFFENRWNDLFDWDRNAGGAILEWDADCNGDGFVDYGQIVAGIMTDANSNNIPDCCEAAGGCSSDLLVPQHYPTINAAMLVARNADTIIVAPGVYMEVVSFNGKQVRLRSRDGAAVTRITRPPESPSSPTILFNNSEGPGSVLDGFTITGGTGVFTNVFPPPLSDGYQLGGGLYIIGASPMVTNCVITNNRCETYFSRGGGIYIAGGSARIEHCRITNNVASGGYGSGAGIYVADGSPVLKDCVLTGNSVYSYHSGNCGGIAVAGGSPSFMECRINGNSASGGVGGMCISPSTTLARVYLGPLNGTTPFAGSFHDGGGNDLDGDCNNNGVPDNVDLANGTSVDVDMDLMPDECTCNYSTCVVNCPGDLDANGVIDGADIGLLLSSWGFCGANCPYDLNNDGKVNGGDLGLLLSGWGTCGN